MNATLLEMTQEFNDRALRVDDELSRRTVGSKPVTANKSARQKAAKELLQFLQKPDVFLQIDADPIAFKANLDQARSYDEAYVHSDYVQAYSSSDWGGSSVHHPGHTEYSTRTRLSKLNVNNFLHGDLAHQILEALVTQAKLKEALPKYEELKAAVNAEDIKTLTAMTDFLKGTGFTQEQFKNFNPIPPETLIAEVASQYCAGEGDAAEKAANIKFCASIPAFSGVMQEFPAMVGTLKRDLASDIKTHFAAGSDNKKPTNGDAQPEFLAALLQARIVSPEVAEETIAPVLQGAVASTEYAKRIGELPRQVQPKMDVEALTRIRGERKTLVATGRAVNAWADAVGSAEDRAAASSERTPG